MRRHQHPPEHPSPSRGLSLAARLILVPVAGIGAALSFRSLYLAAVPTFGPVMAAGFPLLVDLLILGASLQYVAGAAIGRPMAGWRVTAHAGVVCTVVLNALAAGTWAAVPWHVVAPAVWAVLVELTARQVLGEWVAQHTARSPTIALSLWVSAPVESLRTRLMMARTGTGDAVAARRTVGAHAAAREALRLALPERDGRRVRKTIHRQLRAGSLPPAAILDPLGWSADAALQPGAGPEVVLLAVLRDVLGSSGSVPGLPAYSVRRSGGRRSSGNESAVPQPVSPRSLVGRLEPQPAAISGADDQLSIRRRAGLRGQVDRTSSREPAAARELRLALAVDVVRRQPTISVSELRASLARSDWTVSRRTAGRILAQAMASRASISP